MATSKQAKESIAGGCLCGKVRYTVDFPAECPWPPDVSIPVSSRILSCNEEDDHNYKTEI